MFLYKICLTKKMCRLSKKLTYFLGEFSNNGGIPSSNELSLSIGEQTING